MIEIDFEALKYADFEVVNGPTNAAVDKAFSTFLKKHRAKQASEAKPRAKNARPLPAKGRTVRTASK